MDEFKFLNSIYDYFKKVLTLIVDSFALNEAWKQLQNAKRGKSHVMTWKIWIPTKIPETTKDKIEDDAKL